MKKDSDKTQITLVETSLQQNFNGITAKQLGDAFADTEYKRADWLVSAVMFGIKCIAVKPLIEHGNFWDFLAKSIKDKDGKSLASARLYMGLAAKVVRQIATPEAESEIGAKVIAYFKQKKIKFGKFDGVLSTEESVSEFLKYLLQGYSLRGLTKALQGIDFALAAEENRQKKLDGELPLDGQSGGRQQDFFDLLDRDIFSIDEKIKSRELARLPKDKVLKYADALVERGQKLRAAVENADDGE